MVHWSGCTKHLSVGSSGQLTQHVLHWMSELHCSRHFFSTSTHVRGTSSIEVSALSKRTLSGSAARAAAVVRHLNFLPKTGSRRLGAVALRHALDGLLRAGCPAARPAPRVLHEEFRGVNFGKAVPGLLEEARDRAREPQVDGRVEVADVDAELERVGRGDAAEATGK